ncbi:MAG TPA: hypothetical protein PKD12_01065 [Nitrospira sp.]|nr:hypothetical protein [Nitrospira sp.]
MMRHMPICLLMALTMSAELAVLSSAATADDLRQSSRVGALRLSLSTYEQIPIGTLLTHPDRYHMREIRITGTVMATQTETITNRMICGRAHERTTLTVEDDSGKIEVLDRGACGWNVGTLKAPMLKAGQQIDLLVQIMISVSAGTPGPSVEATIRYIEPVRE